MNKLTANDIEFKVLKRAEKEGDTPSVTFRILNKTKVDAFIKDTTAANFLWGTHRDGDTMRLNYKYGADENTITFARSVTAQTFAAAANLSLADAVITLIMSDDSTISDTADIYIGLTRSNAPYSPSAYAIKNYNKYFTQAPSETFTANI